MMPFEVDIQTFLPDQKLPDPLILAEQAHETKIVEVVTGNEDLSVCDGMWTRNLDLALGIRTADCAPIVFYDNEKFGILHAGWRGLCGGICEQMMEIFNVQTPRRGVCTDKELKIFVGPILPQFEIQRDFCYEAIYEKFGDQFFNTSMLVPEIPHPSGELPFSKGAKSEKVIFDFEGAIRSVLPQAEFDGRSTFEHTDLASWRRDKNSLRNVTVVKKA